MEGNRKRRRKKGKGIPKRSRIREEETAARTLDERGEKGAS